MSRFSGWDKPAGTLKQSAQMYDDFDELRAARQGADTRIETWAATVNDDWLERPLVWFSGAANREVTAPRTRLVAHFFNHQTHHRGQAHALITAAGEKTDDTDLFLVVPGVIA